MGQMNKPVVGALATAAAAVAFHMTRGGEVDLTGVAIPSRADSVVRTLGGINDLATKSNKPAAELDSTLGENRAEGKEIWTKLTPTSSVKFSFTGHYFDRDRHVEEASITYLGDENPAVKDAYLDGVREENLDKGLTETDTHIFNPGGKLGTLIRMDLVKNPSITDGKSVTSGWMWIPTDLNSYADISNKIISDIKDGKLDTPVIGRYGVKDFSEGDVYIESPSYVDSIPGYFPERSRDGRVNFSGDNLRAVPVFEVKQIASEK